MSLWFNYVLAWVSAVLVFILSSVFILRILSQKLDKCKNFFGVVNSNVRKYHKHMGVTLILTGLIHGLVSSVNIVSLNLGTFCWIFSILLGVNWITRRRLSKTISWVYCHRLLTIILLITIIWHVVDVGGIRAHEVLFSRVNTVKSQSDKTGSINLSSKKLENAEFKDGVYTGEAQGYRQELKVQIEVKDNKILGIDVTKHNESNLVLFFTSPIERVSRRIVENQSMEVDTVSGATFTSIGIINAVNDALSKALIKGELPEKRELPRNNRRGH